MIYVKVQTTPNGEMVAMCDSELLGKVYKQGKMELDLLKYADFYKGELVAEKVAAKNPALASFYTANIVGEKAVGIFLKRKLISKDEIKMIKDVPYVQLFKLI